MSSKTSTSGADRQDRLLHEHVHDPYKTPAKLTEPTLCPECRAVYHRGRWTWDSPPAGREIHEQTCQACHRTRDEYPAGIITLSGRFAVSHRGELLNLIQNEEQAEKSRHPLHRVMAIEQHTDKVRVTTTDIHLPRRIGHALQHAYKGELQVHYDPEGYLARVDWQRDD